MHGDVNLATERQRIVQEGPRMFSGQGNIEAWSNNRENRGKNKSRALLLNLTLQQSLPEELLMQYVVTVYCMTNPLTFSSVASKR